MTGMVVGIPFYQIKSDGKDLPATLGLVSLHSYSELNRIDHACLVFEEESPADGSKSSMSTSLNPGAKLELSLGYDEKSTAIFAGEITGMQLTSNMNCYELRVDCRVAAWKMTVAPVMNCFIDKKDSEIVNTLASNHGLSCNSSGLDTQHAQLLQHQLSDWDMLLSRAQANSLLTSSSENKIKIFSPDYSSEPVLKLALVPQEDGIRPVINFHYQLESRRQLNSVKFRSWDYENDTVLATDANKPDYFSSSTPGLAASDSAPDKEVAVTGTYTKDDVKALANSVWLQAGVSTFQASISCEGTADVNPGDIIELSNLGERFDGKAFVASVNHEFRQGLWTTVIGTGLSEEWLLDRMLEHRGLDSGNCGSTLQGLVKTLHIGMVVANTEDPDDINRVQVLLPLLYGDDHEGVWSRVSLLDAGETHSSFFFPDVGDEVVVGFIGDDANTPIVLGKLHSKQRPAPEPVSDNNTLRGFFTNSKMKLLFDDELKKITLETPAGNSIQLDEDGTQINLSDQNGNTLILNADGIKLDSPKDIVINAKGECNITSMKAMSLSSKGDFSAEGMNSSISANAKVAIDGKTGADFTTNAIAMIKGNLVKIN